MTTADLDKFDATWDYFNHVVEFGSAVERYRLGMHYLADRKGRITENYPRAFKLLTVATMQDHYAPAMHKLGYCYVNGLGTDKDSAKAKIFAKLAHLQEMADAGEAEAQCRLGCHCLDGSGGVELDAQRAFALFEAAALQGCAPAINKVLICYATGVGVARDAAIAELFNPQVTGMRLTTDNKRIGAQLYCADCYLQRSKAVMAFSEHDRNTYFKKAFYLYYQAATEQNNAEAQYRLSNLCEEQDIIHIDDKQIHAWLEAAASQGHAAAQCELAYCYLFGSGVEEDTQKAFDLFTAAANQHHSWAQYVLADFYIKGSDELNLKPDMQRAFDLYTQAAAQGHVEARHALEEYFSDGLKDTPPYSGHFG